MNPLSPVTVDTFVDGSAESRDRRPESSADAPAVRVLVADAQAIDRRALAALLHAQPGVRVVAEAASGDEALALAREHGPDVIVATTALPVSCGEPLLPWLLAAEPGLRVVAISQHGRESCVVLNPPAPPSLPDFCGPPCAAGADCLQVALAQGALGTVRRSADPERLYAAVRAVAAGRPSHDAAALAAAARAREPGSSPRAPLSPREVEVAALIGRGLSNRDIGRVLEISEPTVKKHVGRVLAKLGVEDRLQAGLFVTRHPLLFAGRSATRPEAPALDPAVPRP